MCQSKDDVKKVLSLAVFSYFFCPFLSAKGQVTSIGSEHRFDVATWNIEWFGSLTNGPSNDDFQWQQVFEIIRDSNIDVWALQEIADEARFFSLLNALGSNWHGELASLSGTQKLAFVYNTDVLRDVSVEHILTESNATYPFDSRPPLALHGMVSLTDTTFAATLINVYKKAFMDQTSLERRVQASG